MKRIASCLVVSTLLLSVAPRLAADVKTQHKTTFQLGGMRLLGLLRPDSVLHPGRLLVACVRQRLSASGKCLSRERW